jgi:hypothetical protein
MRADPIDLDRRQRATTGRDPIDEGGAASGDERKNWERTTTRTDEEDRG